MVEVVLTEEGCHPKGHYQKLNMGVQLCSSCLAVYLLLVRRETCSTSVVPFGKIESHTYTLVVCKAHLSVVLM